MSDSDDSFFSACNVSFNSSYSNVSFCDANTLGSTLVQSYKDIFNTFNVCHINAQSIPSHFSDLLDTFSDSPAHAILVTESWLKPPLDSNSFALPGYILIRNDRIGKGGGGVAIYLRGDIVYSVILSSPSVFSFSAEYLFLEVLVMGVKVLLGVVYCPPSVDYFSSLESALDSICFSYSHHIIMGDLNTDLLKPTSHSVKLSNLLKSVNLSVLPLKPTHHNLDSPDTLLDLLIISRPDLVVKHGQLLAPGFSHHDLIFLAYKLKTPKMKPTVVWMRNFSKLDYQALKNDAESIDWIRVLSVLSVDDKVSQFNKFIIELFDRHAPLRPVRLRRPPAPWITKAVRIAMSRRDRAFRSFKRDRCNENWELYKIARNRCNRIVRAAKRNYCHNRLSNSSTADAWKFLQSLGTSNKSCGIVPTNISLNDLNKHFSSSSTLDSRSVSTTILEINSMDAPSFDVFSFVCVSEEEVRKTILSLKSNAMGFDAINRSMVVPIIDSLLSTLTHIINTSLSTGVFPFVWRKAFVIPLPKVSNPVQFSNFRPISILPFLSKILEACVHKQLSNFVVKNKILCDFQSGFRPGHSTVTALLKVTEDIRLSKGNGMITILVLIDFSNAFNTVNYDILLALLKHLRFAPTTLDWFASYLQERTQALRVDRSISDWCKLKCGVPQGGILSPLLFSLFINFLSSSLSCFYHLYADDLQLYAHSKIDDLVNAIAIINNNLSIIQNWSKKFGIQVNPNKCQAIIIGSSRKVASLDIHNVPPVTFNGTVIPYSSDIKDLGLYIDNTLNWSTHITEMSRSINFILCRLNRHRNFLPIKTKILLVYTLIFPVLDYADVCYLDLNESHLDKLDRLINNCIRFIFNLRKYDHISSYRSKLGWLSIRQRRKLHILSTLYSILFNPLSPTYLSSKFHFLRDDHNCQLRSSDSLVLSFPIHRSNCMSESFTVEAVRLWNGIPINIRRSVSRTSFKSSLRGFLLAM